MTVQPRSHLPTLPPGRAYRFHTMIKPAGALCNLDCPYCFYLHKSDLLKHRPNARMNENILEQHIRQYIEGNTGEEVVFSWQGGEPTVMGLAFFEKAVELQRKYRKRGQRIANDLQTNGVLLDDRWIEFLQREHFLVGLSIDGPRDLHDRYRYTKGGQPTFDKVMSVAARLRKAGVFFSALCVVNRDVAREPLRVWRFLVDEVGSPSIQFTPCVEPVNFKNASPAQIPLPQQPVIGEPRARPGHPESVVTEWSVDPEDYGTFLCSVWDEWMARDFGRAHVNHFETAIAQALGHPPQTCVSSPVCGKALAVEHDGSLFSCDHFVYPDFRLGNINQQHEADLAFSRQQVAFGLAKSKSLPKFCRACEHLELCWGECPKNRILQTEDGEPGLNYLCSALKRFYSRVRRDMPVICRRLGIENNPPTRKERMT